MPTEPQASAWQPRISHTSPIPPHGEWRLVFQPHGDPHPGEWVETDHPAVIDAMGSAPPCAAQGCQLRDGAALRESVEQLHDELLDGSTLTQTDIVRRLEAAVKQRQG